MSGPTALADRAVTGKPAVKTPLRTTVRRVAGTVGFWVTAGALMALVLLPLGWMITVALKPDNSPVFTVPPQWVPSEHWEWGNIGRALFSPERPFFRYTVNTAIVVAANIFGTLLSCSLIAFAFARLRFRGRDVLFWVVIVTMLVPWQALIVPQFLMWVKLGFFGTFLPLIVPSFFGNAFYIFLMRQYMKTIPREMDEAALIDGCGYLRLYWSVILPLSRPVLAVVAVFVFLFSWTDLLGPLLYLNSNDDFTIAIGLATFVTRADTDWNLLMAANIVMMLPPLIVYFFAQDKIIGGIASLGVKG